MKSECRIELILRGRHVTRSLVRVPTADRARACNYSTQGEDRYLGFWAFPHDAHIARFRKFLRLASARRHDAFISSKALIL